MPGIVRKSKVRKVTGPEAVDQLRALADKMEPKVARSFLEAIESLRGQIPEAELAKLIEAGDIDGIMQLLDPDAMTGAFENFAFNYSDAVLRGGQLAADLQEPVIGVNGRVVNFVFNATNPKLGEFARNNSSKRIREIGEDVRQVTRDVIQRSTLAGQNPLTTARDVRQSIGLTRTQERSVSNYRRYLENLDRTALERELRDRRFDRTISRAINEGRPLPQNRIDRMVERYRQRYVKHRSQVIARTESIRAVQGAQHALMQSYIDEGRISEVQVKRFWWHTQDERTRPWHRTIPAINEGGVGQNEPFKTAFGPLMFPGDPDAPPENTVGCRCAVTSRVISAELLEDTA